MMVLLIIALFLLGILLGMQIDEFFFLKKDDKDNAYAEGYDEGYYEGYSEGSKSIDDLYEEARRGGYAECMNDYDLAAGKPTSLDVG